MVILGILYFTLLATPLVFQILFGNGLIPAGKKIKFWHTCVISVALLFVTGLIDAKIISYNLAKNEIRDGLPFVGLIMLEAIMAVAILLTILIQILIKHSRNRKKD